MYSLSFFFTDLTLIYYKGLLARTYHFSLTKRETTHTHKYTSLNHTNIFTKNRDIEKDKHKKSEEI